MTPTVGVADVFTFTSLSQPAVTDSVGESHVRKCASTSRERYIRAKETIPSSFASSFSMGIATVLPLKRERERKREAAALVWTRGLRESMGYQIVEVKFLATCTAVRRKSQPVGVPTFH